MINTSRGAFSYWQIEKKYNSWESFCLHFILAWAEHNAKWVFGLQSVWKQRHESLPGRRHLRLIPIGCLREIKENNCQLIGCSIFHGALICGVFVFPLAVGIIIRWGLTHLSWECRRCHLRECHRRLHGRRKSRKVPLWMTITHVYMSAYIYKHI